jgi:hypothetical protein
LLLIVLTIAFEKAKEHIEESADRNMKPIIGSLFGEMTVLGFLSIFTFCVTQLGFFEHISMSLFGKEEELQETFEFVHYMLFFIMVFFVVSVLNLVFGAENMEATWWTMNAACRDAEYMTQLDALVVEQESMGWISYLCGTLFPCTKTSTRRFRNNLMLFRGIRDEFLSERSMEPPFDANPNRVADDFNFGRYLSICLGHTLGHVVEVNVLTWSFFAVLTVVFFGVILAVANQVAVRYVYPVWRRLRRNNCHKNLTHACATTLTTFATHRPLLGSGLVLVGSSFWLEITSTITFGGFYKIWWHHHHRLRRAVVNWVL